jgi:hypothetical protein
MWRRLRPLLLIVSLAVLVGGGATPASAYGTDHLFQITFSENCQDPTLCVQSASNPFGIGGIWGWVEPDTDGTAEASVTIQGHSNVNPVPPTVNGTIHLPTTWNWQIIHLSTPPPPIFSPPDPNGNYFFFTITNFQGFRFLTPATPGQYSENLGPGIDALITVTQMN